MAATATATASTTSRPAAGPRRLQPPPQQRQSEPARRRVPWLALAAAAYAVAQLLLVLAGHPGLGWDETVYLSQADPRTPAAFFSAPRSRGISYLVAPVLAVTGSATALRLVLAAAAALALYAAFRVWRPLLGRAATALGAAVFSSLWVTVFYGPQVMPNLWTALAAVAAAGWCLRAAQPAAPRRALVLLACCVAAATLFRFSDGIWLALPLLAAPLLLRDGRRTGPVLAVLAGLAAGAAQWIAEAYVRFGGVRERLRLSSGTEGGMRPHWNAGTAWRGLGGPLLCRPCTARMTQHAQPAHTVWWLALPVLAAAACAVAVRARRPAGTLLPVACAAALSTPYLLLLDYFAPRFLLPAYALLSLPVGALAVHAVRALRPGAARAGAVAALLALFAAHVGTQFADLHTNLVDSRSTGGGYRAAADGLHRLGVRPPCLVSGEHAPPIAYYAGCSSANVAGNNRNTSAAALRHRAAHAPLAALARTHRPGYVPRDWTGRRLPGTGLTAYLPPHPPGHGPADAAGRAR